MESPTHSLADKALRCLSTIIRVLDFSSIKNELFPVVAAVFSRTSSLAIKTRGLEAFVILCGGGHENETIEDSASGAKSAILDKYTVQEKIVPLMRAIKTKEPAVMMASLAVFKQIGIIADADFLATDVLPILWGFALGPLLNMNQFQQYMDLIKTTSSRIESEHLRKLRALAAESGSAAEPNTVSTNNDLMSLPNDGSFSPSTNNFGEDDFARLVLGKGGSSSSAAGPQPPTRSQTASISSNNPAAPNKPIYDFGWSSTPTLQPQPNSVSSRAITPDFTASSMNNSISSFPAMQAMAPNTGSTRPQLQPTPASFSGTSMNNHAWTLNAQQQQQPQANYNAWSSPPASSPAPSAPVASGWSLPPPPGASSMRPANAFGAAAAGAGAGSTMGRSNMMPMNAMSTMNNASMTGATSNGMMGSKSMNTLGTAQTANSMGSLSSANSGLHMNAPPSASPAWSQMPLQPQGAPLQPQIARQQQQQQPQKSGLDKYDSLI